MGKKITPSKNDSKERKEPQSSPVNNQVPKKTTAAMNPNSQGAGDTNSSQSPTAFVHGSMSGMQYASQGLYPSSNSAQMCQPMPQAGVPPPPMYGLPQQQQQYINQGQFATQTPILLEIIDRLKSMDTKLCKLDVIESSLGKLEGRVISMETGLNTMKAKLDTVEHSVEFISGEYDILKAKQGEIDELRDDIESMTYRNKELMDKTNTLERFSRENNIRLVGYPETEGEDVFTIVSGVIDTIEVENVNVTKAHRIGRRRFIQGKPQPRPIIFKVLRHNKRIELLQKSRDALKSKDYFLADDMTSQDLSTKRALQPVIDKAKRDNKPWKFRNGKLIIDGRVYDGPIPDAPAYAASR
jgi:hypothetical protein